jgi:hypothetical protein
MANYNLADEKDRNFIFYKVENLQSHTSLTRLVLIHILNFKMTLFFGICFFLYFLKLSTGRGFIFYDRYNHIWKPGLKLLHATCLQLELYCVIGDVFGCMIRLKI